MEAESFAGTVDGGQTDAQTACDFLEGEALMKPATHKLFLGFVERAGPARRRMWVKAVDAVALIASLPASLGGDGMSEGVSQFFLGGEFALAKHDSDVTQMREVVQGEPMDGLMATKNNAVAIAINKPQGGVDESVAVC